MSWKKVKISEVSSQIRGVTYKPENISENPTDNHLPILRAGNITETGLLFDDLVYVDRKNISENQILKEGDIVIAASSGSKSIVGKANYFGNNWTGSFGAFCKVIRPNKVVFPKYLSYYFQTKDYRNKISKLSEGANINNLRSEDLDNLLLPLPSNSTQQKIASILDKADELRRKDQQLLLKYDELLQSIFYQMFGDPVKNEKEWELFRFSEVGSLDRGVSKNRPRNAPELLKGPYPLIQTGDVANSGGYIIKYKSTYSEIGLKQSKMWKAGTLCITIAANIAKTGILTFDACFPDSVVGFIPNNKTNVEFAQLWLSHLQEMLEATAPVSAQKNINLDILRNLRIPVPPILLQDKFADIAQSIRLQKEQVIKQKSLSDKLFQSLLQKAFKEELIS